MVPRLTLNLVALARRDLRIGQMYSLRSALFVPFRTASILGLFLAFPATD
jgi:hypothetical protein